MDLRATVLNIFVVVFIILALMVLIDLLGIDLRPPPVTKKLTQIVTIEGLEKIDTTIRMSPADDFCTKSSKSSCEKLTDKNCNKTSCCVLLNGIKCVSGSEDGPTFKTNKGEKVSVDYYYYQNKCYGLLCK